MPGSHRGIEILPHHDPTRKPVAGGQKAIKVNRRVEGYGLLLGEGYCGIARVDTIASVFDLCNRGLAARVDDFHPPYFLVRLSRFLQHFLLSRKHFILVHIAQSADNFIFSAGSVSRALHIDHVAPDKLGGGGRLQATHDKVGVRQDLLVDKARAVQIRIGGGLHPFGGKSCRSRGGALRGVGRNAVGGRLRPYRSREQQQEQSCFLHVTSGKERTALPPLVKCHKRKAQPEGNKRVRVGQGYEGVSPPSPKVFRRQC